MRRILLGVCILLAFARMAFAQDLYGRFFTDLTMRVDYYHSGTKGEESFGIDEVFAEGPWAGSRVNLVDTLNLGEYLLRVYDRATGQLIYSRGFSSKHSLHSGTSDRPSTSRKSRISFLH